MSVFGRLIQASRQRPCGVLEYQYTACFLHRYSQSLHKPDCAECWKIRDRTPFEVRTERLAGSQNVRTAPRFETQTPDTPVSGCCTDLDAQPLIFNPYVRSTVDRSGVRRRVEELTHPGAVRIGAHWLRSGAIARSLPTAAR